jgi:hypothetical protein
LEDSNALNFERVKFFLENTYFDSKGEARPCFLLSKMGCEMVANKLTGEKGVLFTAAYVTKFNAMETAEREQLEALASLAGKPQLRVFNTAVRNVLGGFSYAHSSPYRVMEFLHGAYQPFGIAVAPYGDNYHTLTATDIACLLEVYSENGLPHGHAVAKIIENLNIAPEHIEIAPYGLVGISVRYDFFVFQAVKDWLAANNYPREIPHLNFKYHIYYDRQLSFDDLDLTFSPAELDELCSLFDDCDACPGKDDCCGTED